MDDTWARIADNVAARISGPMAFRLVLQPAVAAFFAIRAGLADARAGRPPYLRSLVSGRGERLAIIGNGLERIGTVFVLAVLLDSTYQLIVSRFVYPGEAIVVGFVLSIVPYLVLRGLVTRLARSKRRVTN